MFRYVLSSASDYFYLPIDDEPQTEGQESSLPPHARHISWASADDILEARAQEAESHRSAHAFSAKQKQQQAAIAEILAQSDLYKILGVPRAKSIDKMDLRRAYLARSKACHPDKFPDNPEATLAFQKVSVAYDVLSTPASKRLYDSHPAAQDFSSAASTGAHAEETLRGVVLGVFNDFLDGDLEMIHTLLRAVQDLNPALRLGEDGIDSILVTLQALRERVLTCRAVTHALVSTLSHLLETHAALAQHSYFAIRPRARLSIQLARITLGLPLALETAVRQHRHSRARSRARRGAARRRERSSPTESEDDSANEDIVDDERAEREREREEFGRIFPRRVLVLIEALVVVLERMEGVLK
ncbi:DnaJ-domain-containing protein [Stereum hirsutum FP-91666 SS1]|uniref:DnaJ-domain-containing protein n=1 Tax=Stereum hirsutum (strain FP-91666) TaxID=721885 RepID=UPI000440E55E|nr:DnaJ-domain-containing protein [Stereum hirsutum FP-91666 SS1]EIM90828.1 DnaJ-domain-containing protein [Stereum hirsutum FP-91666 SS1]